jgi:hypothetical protein
VIPEPDNRAPCLSVVVTTRNDDHGGDPLKRLQAFVDTFDEQSRRANLDAEVIVVEWNPPADKPRVSSLLRLPQAPACTYRFVVVPADLHQTLQFGDVLPLFQMIAKNVGIRRARGRFVVATNIDIIFSTALVEFIASQRLERGVMYRVDRHDIQSDIPVDAPLEAQLTYCETHQLRVHARHGSYPVDGRGHEVCGPGDIVDGREVRLGGGWHVKEGGGEWPAYRWVTGRAGLIVERAGESGLELLVDVESNPFDPDSTVEIEALQSGVIVARARIKGRATLPIPLQPQPTAGACNVELRVVNASDPTRLPSFERREQLYYRIRSARLSDSKANRPTMFEYPVDRWTNAYERSGVAITSRGRDLSIVTDPRKLSYAVQYGPLSAAAPGVRQLHLTCSVLEGDLAVGVLSGDRLRWLPATVRKQSIDGETRFELSVDLPSTQTWLVVSNDHPRAAHASRFVIHRLECDVPAKEMLSDSAMPVPLARTNRALRRRVSAALDVAGGWLASMIADRMRYRIVRATPEFQGLNEQVQVSLQRIDERNALDHLAGVDTFLRTHRPDNLHVNGCGDFQLMAREHWDDLRAYPEFETFSMNIDGLFSYIAAAAGIREQVLAFPIYHLEHEVGSGWSPEGEALLRKRIAERGITWVDASTVHMWAAYMCWLRRPMLFNNSTWGMSDAQLPEHIVSKPAPSHSDPCAAS